MSWDNFALHMYGVDVYNLGLTDEIKALCGEDNENCEACCGTFDELFDHYNSGDDEGGAISEELFDKLDDFEIDIHYGPGASLYVGFDAAMPYDIEHVYPKEELDKHIYDFIAFFCGEETAKANTPYEIYEVWTE